MNRQPSQRAQVEALKVAMRAHEAEKRAKLMSGPREPLKTVDHVINLPSDEASARWPEIQTALSALPPRARKLPLDDGSTAPEVYP